LILVSRQIVYSGVNYLYLKVMKNFEATDSETFDRDLSKLADSVGDFIRYWGFRRIHGQIWTLLFLRNEAVSPTEIAKSLGVSKSLISSALTELEDHKLIMPVEDDVVKNKKTKFFKAEQDVVKIIQDILKKRELKLIANVQTDIAKLKKKQGLIDPERLERLELWTSIAHTSVRGISELGSFEDALSFE